jgi:sugar phosphate isomerase/epimerase
MGIENLSRRTILKSGLLLFVGGCASQTTQKGEKTMGTSKCKIPLGLQLYTVREECKKDFAGTIAKVAKMGYNGVEFAGFYDKPAKDVRKMLDDNGLLCFGSHTAIDLLSNEKLAATMEYNKTIGNKFVIVPYLERKQLTTKAAWLEKAKTFNELADKTRAEGVHIGYHAHQGDFEKIDGETPWDILFGNTPKEICMQLDTGNCMQGGGDPVAILKKYPGRSLTIHLKEYSKTNKKALIGEGDVKWKEIFEVCESTGGTQYYILEEESGAYPPLESAEKSLKNFKKIHG